MPQIAGARIALVVPRNLHRSLGDMTQRRSRVILAALSEFRPHVFLVDHAAEGMRGALDGSRIHPIARRP